MYRSTGKRCLVYMFLNYPYLLSTHILSIINYRYMYIPQKPQKKHSSIILSSFGITQNCLRGTESFLKFNVLARIIYMIIIKCTFCIVYMIIVISEPGLNTPINIYGNDNINAMEISLR